MAEKQPKKGLPLLLEKLLGVVLDPKVIGAILVSLGIGGGGGFALADAGGAQSARMDSLEVRQDSAESRMTRMEKRQMEMYSAQIEADTALKTILERKAADRRKAAEERAGAEKLFNDILGGSQ